MPSPLQKKSKVKLCWPSDNEYKKNNSFNEPMRTLKNSTSGKLLFHSDNLTSVKYLLANGFEKKIDLVYIDPPFACGEKYYHRMKNIEKPAFEDIFRGKIDEYLDMIYPRLEVIQKLISARGSIFVHLDWHLSHYVKVIMDEIFGYENFRNEIIVKRGRRKNLLYQFKSIDRMHVANDSILWYSKSAGTKFQHPLVENKKNSKWMGFWSNVNRPTMRYKLFGFVPERGQWKWSEARALLAIENYKVYEGKFADIPLEEYWRRASQDMEFIRKRPGVKYPEYWIPPKTHVVLDNIWTDIESYSYSTGYDTEKHEQLLERIIGQFSRARGLVADFFCGSGTTLVVAQRLGRSWIGCDCSSTAIQVTKRRLPRSDFSLIKAMKTGGKFCT
jgi:adenine specific DNA methylase Mod